MDNNIIYRPTHFGVFVKSVDDAMKCAAMTLDKFTIKIVWNDGFNTNTVERAAREWYPMAKRVEWLNGQT